MQPSESNENFVTIVRDGVDLTYATTARTVRAFLAERNIHLASADRISPSPNETIADGSRVVIESAVPVAISVDRHTRLVHVVPTTVADLLASQNVSVGKHDVVSPPLNARVSANEFVRVVHVRSWTTHERLRIAAGVRNRPDPRLARGRTVTLEKGRSGVRELTYRYVRRGNEAPVRTLVRSRVERPARARVVLHGTAAPPSLARVAEQGFRSALHFAGSALHMIATAYTAGCYGCSGITASGVRAGFGIIAVDPRVIPLGTKLFIPGYGRAVAGDTGGAILGNRIDLGMNTNSAAMQFGRRSVTVYVLR